MFLSEEQQSLIKLRQEIDELQAMQQQQQEMQPEMNAEDYDEWACIQRELGCLPDGTSAVDTSIPTVSVANSQVITSCAPVVSTSNCTPTTSTITTSSNTIATSKRPASIVHQQEKVETKKQRMEKTSRVVAVGNQNGLQSAEATRFVLKSSSLTNINGTEQQTRPNMHNLQQVNVNFNATQQPQQQRFNIQQQQQQQQQYTHVANYQQQLNNAASGMNLNNYNCSMTSAMSSSGSSASTRSNNEENDSIDEQVQSAIDSILNLQQNNLDLDETMQNMLS